jgi:hypothetical protein
MKFIKALLSLVALTAWLGGQSQLPPTWGASVPKSLGDLEWFDIELLRPGEFVAGLMRLAVMTTVDGNGELVAHI